MPFCLAIVACCGKELAVIDARSCHGRNERSVEGGLGT
jgi:hypothetical protein